MPTFIFTFILVDILPKKNGIYSSTLQLDQKEKDRKVKFSKISFFEYFHSGIPADRHWSICFEVFVILPSSERFELVEGEVEGVLGELWTAHFILEEILPEELLALDADFSMSEYPEVKGKSSKIFAGRPKISDEVGEAYPYLVVVGRRNLAGEPKGF